MTVRRSLPALALVLTAAAAIVAAQRTSTPLPAVNPPMWAYAVCEEGHPYPADETRLFDVSLGREVGQAWQFIGFSHDTKIEAVQVYALHASRDGGLMRIGICHPWRTGQ